MLVVAVIALAVVDGAQADTLPVPSVSVPSLPSVPLPPVPTPAVPPVLAPVVPQAPRQALPQVPAPSLPRVPRPAAPSVPAAPVAPARTRPGAAAPRQRSESRAGAGATRVARADGAAAGSPARSRTAARSGAASRAAGASRERPASREPSSKRLRRLLEPLAACVATLGPLQERVIVRRAGLRGHRGQTRSEVARALDISRSRVARVERRALRSLRRTIRAGGCSGPVPSATTSETVKVALGTTPPPGAEGPTPPADRQEVKGVAKSGSRSVVERAAEAGRQTIVDAPAAAAALTEPARSYADDHPYTFGLAVLITLLCAVLLVRELRRSL